jgi:hypothetical protein
VQYNNYNVHQPRYFCKVRLQRLPDCSPSRMSDCVCRTAFMRGALALVRSPARSFRIISALRGFVVLTACYMSVALLVMPCRCGIRVSCQPAPCRTLSAHSVTHMGRCTLRKLLVDVGQYGVQLRSTTAHAVLRKEVPHSTALHTCTRSTSRQL